jgi:hypothetical protein
VFFPTHPPTPKTDFKGELTMCKVMVLAGIVPEKQKAAWSFLTSSVPFMTKQDKDGLGYAAASGGRLFGERWVNPKDAFKKRVALSPRGEAMRAALKGAMRVSESYNSFGNVSTTAQAVTLHSRMATCGKGLTNTHPFVSGDTSLIHNGVITNVSELTQVTSTCDSETILNEYVKFDIMGQPGRIQELARALQGYYACAVITKDSTGRQVVDIFKDTRAQLCVGYVEELGAWVYCTTEGILRATAKAAKMTVTECHAIAAGFLIRLDAVTGEVLQVEEFTPNPIKPALRSVAKNYATQGEVTRDENYESIASRYDDDSHLDTPTGYRTYREGGWRR